MEMRFDNLVHNFLAKLSTFCKINFMDIENTTQLQSNMSLSREKKICRLAIWSSICTILWIVCALELIFAEQIYTYIPAMFTFDGSADFIAILSLIASLILSVLSIIRIFRHKSLLRGYSLCLINIVLGLLILGWIAFTYLSADSHTLSWKNKGVRPLCITTLCTQQ